MSPVVLGIMISAAGGALLVGVGIMAAEPVVRLLTRRLARAHRDLHRYRRQLACYERDLHRAETEVRELGEAVAEYKEAIPKIWDAVMAIRLQRGAEVWELPADVAEQGRANWRRN